MMTSRMSGGLAALLLCTLAGCAEDPNAPTEHTPQFLLGDCSPTLDVSPLSATAGETLTFTATGNCSEADVGEYRFWLQKPNGTWQMLQDYTAGANVYAWHTTAATVNGAYNVQVWVRKTTNPTSVYDGAAQVSDVQISGGSSGGDCSIVSLDASPDSPVTAGDFVDLTAEAACAEPEYLFWLRRPDSVWVNVCGSTFGPSGDCEWDTLTYPPGAYEIQVWSRAQGSSSLEGVAIVQDYVVNTGETGCPRVELTVEPNGIAGAPITLTGDAGCIGTPEYKFWVNTSAGWINPCGDYSTSSECEWDSDGEPAGEYEIQVWARAQGSIENYESFDILEGYTLSAGSGCFEVALATSPDGIAAVGETVDLMADASCATGSDDAEYLFWVNTSGGWTNPCGGYSSAGLCAWDTTGLDTGSYEVQVWTRTVGTTPPAGYDSYAILPAYELVAPQCTGVALAANPPGGTTTGEIVFLSATPECVGVAEPEYVFWIKDPVSGWWSSGEYSPVNEFGFPAVAPGTYEFQVWIRKPGDADLSAVDVITSYVVI